MVCAVPRYVKLGLLEAWAFAEEVVKGLIFFFTDFTEFRDILWMYLTLKGIQIVVSDGAFSYPPFIGSSVLSSVLFSFYLNEGRILFLSFYKCWPVDNLLSRSCFLACLQK